MLKVTLHQWEPYIDIPLLFVLTLAIIFSGFNQWPILVADQKTSNCVKLVHAPWLKGDDWTKYLVFLQSATQTLNVHSQSFCGLCLPDLWSRQLCSLWQEGRCVDSAGHTVFQFGVGHRSSVQSKMTCGDLWWSPHPVKYPQHPVQYKESFPCVYAAASSWLVDFESMGQILLNQTQWQIIHEMKELINESKKLKIIRFVLLLYNKDIMTGSDLFKGQLKEYNAVIVTQTGKPGTVSVMAWATWSVFATLFALVGI